jgi:EF-P beta-lysylation protein EpmB
MHGVRTLAEPDCDATPGRQEAGARGPSWQNELAQAFRRPADLLAFLGLPPPEPHADHGFPLLVPRGFAARMTPGDARDALLRQVLVSAEESLAAPGFTDDPVGESGCAEVPGLLRKYRGRALLVATGACAVHCRYCFRRHFPYNDLPRGERWWSPAIAAVAADPTIEELILSGGDPLTLPDQQLAAIVAAVAAIPQVTRLRIHTRLPVVLPARVDAGLLAWLQATRLTTVVVIHANHPAEIDGEVAAACARLRGAGVMLLNQSVLLAGVNDAASVLADLSRRLFAAGVLPYYLHQLDRVRGASHFAVADARALAIANEMTALLPGYLVPKLVREIADAPAKRALTLAA